MKKLLKENVVDFLRSANLEVQIFISSSLKNLDYYYSKLREKGEEVKLFKANINNLKELLDVNVRLIETLKENSKNKKYILIDFNLAMSIFFERAIYIELKQNEEYKIEELEEKLVEYGYQKEYLISELGQYSKRGDILDIFSFNMEDPIRLDFFDTELEKIKLFDIETQKSFDTVKKIKIFSNKLEGANVLITELAEKLEEQSFAIYLENKELLDYHLETMILLDTNEQEKLVKRYKQIREKSTELIVELTEKRNYSSEIKEILKENKRKHLKFKSIAEIKKGDYVIHIQHGIGKYNGLELIDDKELISISYADRDKLYLPVDNFSKLEKYINITGEEPTLYKLGTRGFKRRKIKYKEDIEKVAKELIALQAKREQSVGIRFIEDTVWQKEFEEKFPFNETHDQLLAIKEVKEDMQSPKIMDRIVCGDVGYGKTEVAMRAAFKAVESGYQVALLVPTTVLANQHYERFKKRFEDYPVNIQMYSRLSSSKNKLKEISNGNIDIIIGTHKLLSDDVIFSNLGLIIVDEEQKFGVKSKEKLKEKRAIVDLLTLTATPIPRTLNLALLGIRDISIISTPPTQKLPIITEVIENIETKKLRDVILSEISREGQVFYVSNDVKNMQNKKKELEKILPNFVKVEYIHGQLNPSEIRSKIRDFEDEKFQVLIASTIIENGIDIANANTIIIDNFYKLGLSQIYQLRGRVGRGNRQGYCYLLKGDSITKKGQEKQNSIKGIENAVSGGYMISLEDMNIRGAGEILGEKQHGAIESFGYDLYLKMLTEEIDNQKHKRKEILENVQISIKETGYIPEEYIKEVERVKFYKRLSEVKSFEGILSIENEMIDRFGKLPSELKSFIKYIKIKLYAQLNFIEKIVEEKGKFYLHYLKKVDTDEEIVIKLSENELLREIEKSR